MYRILVPLDGSLLAERAIPWADNLAAALGAEIETLRVVGPNDLPAETLADAVDYEMVDHETRSARAVLGREAEQFGLVRPSHQDVVLGEPAATIVARAHTVKANLIVMASHGRSELPRAFLGSVADAVIRESHIPVLVIRADLPTSPLRLPGSVLVPLDGSALAETILDTIAPLAKALGWQLTLFWQVDLPSPGVPVQGALLSFDFLRAHERGDMVEYLERVAAAQHAAGIPTDVRVWFGSRAVSIVRYAAQERFDLIAMSTHGRHGLGRWLLGSVADYVLTHATVPVLALHPATQHSSP